MRIGNKRIKWTNEIIDYMIKRVLEEATFTKIGKEVGCSCWTVSQKLREAGFLKKKGEKKEA